MVCDGDHYGVRAVVVDGVVVIVEAKKEWVFGTGENCDVRILDDELVSTRHCKVTVTEDGSVWVEDLGSTNGTWIHDQLEVALGRFPGMRVYGPMPLPHGWVIRIGRTDVPWKR